MAAAIAGDVLCAEIQNTAEYMGQNAERLPAQNHGGMNLRLRPLMLNNVFYIESLKPLNDPILKHWAYRLSIQAMADHIDGAEHPDALLTR